MEIVFLNLSRCCWNERRNTIDGDSSWSRKVGSLWFMRPRHTCNIFMISPLKSNWHGNNSRIKKYEAIKICIKIWLQNLPLKLNTRVNHLFKSQAVFVHVVMPICMSWKNVKIKKWDIIVHDEFFSYVFFFISPFTILVTYKLILFESKLTCV